MKKLFRIFVCLALLVGFSVAAVSADQISPDSSKYDGTGKQILHASSDEIFVTYTIGSESYQVTIPPSMEFTSSSYEITQTVKVDKVVLTKGRYLNITVKSEHDWTMPKHNSGVADYDYVIPYTMKYTEYQWNNGHPVENSARDMIAKTSSGMQEVVLLQAHGLSEVVSSTLVFKMSDQEIPATGFYQDKLTFKVSVDGTAVEALPSN